ncbi:gluconokinase-like protein [Coniella lustricola]|uniref:Gluconokinase n=1 Tax=Coniella lustricola TaxID=2025994 RepID=A0A2T3ABI0_9PEZI|nr:gluconokinase-like protein [Coniella lustricola]
MLSYDSPVSLNGQSPVSPTNLTTSRQAMAPSKPVIVTKPTDNTLSNNAPSYGAALQPAHHHIWLVTGPAGCGKTTVAGHLAGALDIPYVEGDEFHSPENVAKMSRGQALTDEDRWDWLTRLREEALKQLALGHDGVVVTCSALKRKYRDVIRVAPYFSPGLQVHFIYLDAPQEVLQQRVAQRQGHYMGAGMVQSQFAILQAPMRDEIDCITIDVSRSSDEVCRAALDQVVKKLSEDR